MEVVCYNPIIVESRFFPCLYVYDLRLKKIVHRLASVRHFHKRPKADHNIQIPLIYLNCTYFMYYVCMYDMKIIIFIPLFYRFSWLLSWRRSSCISPSRRWHWTYPLLLSTLAGKWKKMYKLIFSPEY